MIKFRQIGQLVVASIALAAGLVTPALAEDLKIGLSAEPSAMDPHFHNLTPNNALLSHIFERLVETDAASKLIPGLAESCKVLDGNIWEFKLRSGVKWHDGSPFTADDVVFTFERAPNVPNSPSSFASSIKGKTLKKIDDLTIQISTPAPAPLLPTELTNLLIVSKKSGDGGTMSTVCVQR